MTNKLNVYKCFPEAIIPQYSTEYSSCFDIHACLVKDKEFAKVKSFFPQETHGNTEIFDELSVSEDFEIILPANSRSLIPTGLKFQIPINCSVRLHPRSGLSFKNGLMLSNCQGVIDEDYFGEVFVSIYNASCIEQKIKHGDRICQAELISDLRCSIEETYDEPSQKSSRNGGFGSTGK